MCNKRKISNRTMSMYIILTTLIIFYTKYGCAMLCYATDVAELESGGLSPHRLQHCDRYILDSVKKYGIDVSEDLLEGVPTSCYTVYVTVVPGASIVNFEVKGCVPTGYGSVVKGIIQSELKKRNLYEEIVSMNHTECSHDFCNK